HSAMWRRQSRPRAASGATRFMTDPDTAPSDTACPNCRKPPVLCVCSAIEPIDNKIFVLILQHPQEQDRELGSAWIAHRQLKNSRLVVGLSWKGLAAIL